MRLFNQFSLLINITRSHLIARRYFVVNGFDGALAMLGLLMGFYMSNQADLTTIISVCLGAAVALGMSGITSAYISEAAEKQRELKSLEEAMLSNLSQSAHGQAARIMPVIVAITNGLTPFMIALIIMLPLIISHWQPGLIKNPLEIATLLAFVIIFLLGVFLGRISGHFWLWSGIKTLFVALITTLIIFLLKPL
ncbi:MAG: hypothetical protein H6940_11695 [Burkholderiales bacterium]|uniref:hypothetical protein n=1 Tax=Nitrosomonas sp. TaxID=42353 RepID=UPI001E0B58CD|nr:hypothetical protein [Nitrosomonas sp.]MCB1948087.1 hypothetical protein [Nitrosomonas sp.]MCP5244071.1 hypothetical protein [Burkholderiales bacterium]MCP5292645.1 hypothetical protein [Burkholderiales bacterium]